MVPITQSIDTQGLHHHQPFLRAFSAMRKLQCGDVLMLSTNEPQTDYDLQAFCDQSGFELIESVYCEDEFTFLIRRNCPTSQAVQASDINGGARHVVDNTTTQSV